MPDGASQRPRVTEQQPAVRGPLAQKLAVGECKDQALPLLQIVARKIGEACVDNDIGKIEVLTISRRRARHDHDSVEVSLQDAQLLRYESVLCRRRVRIRSGEEQNRRHVTASDR